MPTYIPQPDLTTAQCTGSCGSSGSLRDEKSSKLYGRYDEIMGPTPCAVVSSPLHSYVKTVAPRGEVGYAKVKGRLRHGA